MPGKEFDPTNNKGRGEETKKGLPSVSHESSKEKIPGEDTRGAGSLMANPALKERVAKKQSSETKPQAPSAESSSQVSPRPIFAEALFIREFQRMSAENKRLREENNELVEREERRKEKDRQRKLKKRQDNREEYNTYMRELYARKQQQSKQST